MKKVYLFILLSTTIHIASAQTIYVHDASGNRIKRAGGAALPVMLVSFQAAKTTNDDDVHASLLKWETSSESNSDLFNIQRSVDAKHWQSLGEVKASGESRTNHEYSFKDDDPAEGENFYRLQMLDKDGTFAYSQIRSLHFESQILAYPNPVKDILKLKGSYPGPIQIFTSSGVLVYEHSHCPQAIDMSRMSTGIYVLKLFKTNAAALIKKIVKE